MIITKSKTKSYTKYLTLHEDGTIGTADMFITTTSPRELWCAESSIPYSGFSPMTPKGIKPTKKYKTAIIYGFIPNGKNKTLTRSGNGSTLLQMMILDGKKSNIEMLAVTDVSTQEMKKFLLKNNFTHLPKTSNYIKKISL